LGSGKFGWWETRLVAASLGIFCIGIIAESITPLLSRAFFALQNTKIPAISSLLSFILSISLAFIFTGLLKAGGFFKDFLAGILKLQDGNAVENIEVIGLPMA
jgi:putative peptidoglycan lipid II flippase